MKIKTYLALGFILLVVGISACTVATPTATPTPAPTLTSTPEPTATPTRAPLNVDGRWDAGTLADGLLSGELIFQIENKNFTIMQFMYTLRSNGCTFMTSFSGTADESHINGDEFSAAMYGYTGDYKLSIAGTFESDKQANGTLTFKGTNDCGPFDRTVKWTGANGPIPPTPQPTTPKPTTTTRPSSTPYVPPTLRPSNTATPAATARPELLGLINAINKTKTATVLNLSHQESGSPLLYDLPNDPSNAPVTYFAMDGAINGNNLRLKAKGNGLTSLGGDPAKGFEFIVLNDKGYVHGPVTFFNAPEDRWYTAPGDEFSVFGIVLINVLQGLDNQTSAFQTFEKSSTRATLDNLQCDSYVGGKNSASIFINRIQYSIKPLTTDQESAQVDVCSDGYIHAINATWTGHDSSNRSMTATFKYHASDFNGNVIITAPTEPNMPPITPLFTTTNLATPTAKPVGPSPTPGIATVIQRITGNGFVLNPNSLTVDSTGNIYIGDSFGGKLQIYNAAGKLLNQWNITDLNSAYLYGLAITRQGALYACYDHKILRIDTTTGQVIGTLSYSEGNRFEKIVAAPDGGLLAMWYENNNGATQPIAGHREDIVRFDASGKYSQVYRGVVSAQTNIAENFVRIAVDSLGNIYATSSSDTTPAILKFSPDGKFIARLSDPSANAPQGDKRIFAVAVDRSDNVYVEKLDGIRIFDKTGLYRNVFPIPSYLYSMAFNDQNELLGMAPSEIIKLAINLR